ncbi:MAG: DNA repair ATPase, partial [Actinobacteria bacterium]|nr:DNA repair ATPase [Actinomycetota bacterium]
MTDTGDASAGQTSADTGNPAGGNYDLLRRRLRGRVRDTLEAATSLDRLRTESFGSTQLRLAGSDRLRTDLACKPRDVVRVGDMLMLGYQVSPELAQLTPEHVFGLYERGADDELAPIGSDDERNFLAEPAFREEFDKLHRFYGKARFSDLRRGPNQLLAAFRIGERVDDLVVLRWTVAIDGTVSFVDARGDRDYTWPDSHDMTWVRSTRE